MFSYRDKSEKSIGFIAVRSWSRSRSIINKKSCCPRYTAKSRIVRDIVVTTSRKHLRGWRQISLLVPCCCCCCCWFPPSTFTSFKLSVSITLHCNFANEYICKKSIPWSAATFGVLPVTHIALWFLWSKADCRCMTSCEAYAVFHEELQCFMSGGALVNFVTRHTLFMHWCCRH